MTLDDVLAAVAGRVPYLRATTVIDGDGWIGCDELVVTDRLAVVVERAMDGFGTDDPAVAASLFAQAYAFRIAGVALAAHALDLPVPSLDPASVAVRVTKPRPDAVAFLDPGVHTLDPAALAHALLRDHLEPFVDAVHATFRVGARLLWGDVASSCATAFRAVEGAGDGVDRDAVRARGETFMVAAREWLDGLGAFVVVRAGERDGWYWNRANCCLWYQTSGRQLCDNCSLADPTELHEQRVRELTGPGS